MTVTSRQFSVFRVALGSFLASHFLWLLPYADEIYGSGGMYPPEVRSAFPSVFDLTTSRAVVELITAGLVVLSVLFTIGLYRRIVAVLLWYGWACLIQRVPFLYIPSEGLVGWMLLLSAVVPAGETWAIRPRPDPDWRPPSVLPISVWVVLGVGYLASGIDKLSSPSWREGTAVRSVLISPMARWDQVEIAVRTAPDLSVALLSWSVLAFELTFFVLIWRNSGRRIAWLAATVFHLFIRATLRLHTVTDPFLIAQILTFDVQWLDSQFAQRVRRVLGQNVGGPARDQGK